MSEAAFIIDDAFRITGFNGPAERMFERKHALIGKDVMALLPSLQTYQSAWLRSIEVKAINFIEQGLNSAGSLIRIEEARAGGTSLIVLWNEDTLPPSFPFGYLNGIEEHKGKNQADWIKGTTDALFIFDSDGNYVDANPSACRLSGYEREELLSKRVSDLVPLPYRNGISAFISQLCPGKSVYSTSELLRKDGVAIDIEMCTLLLESGCVAGCCRRISGPSASDVLDKEQSIAWLIQKQGECRFVPNESQPGGGRMVSLSRDAEEARRKERELLQTTIQLRALSAHLEAIREEERTSIARDMHDELGQQLMSLKMDISWLRQKLEQSGQTALLQRALDALEVLDGTIKTIRRIATDLRPSVLDNLGLVAALEWQSREFQKRSGVTVGLQCHLEDEDILPNVSTCLFRIYQEALTNIGKHSMAGKVITRIFHSFGKIVLTINDDGQGFDINATGLENTLGIIGMKERALMIRADFDIQSHPGHGTTITVKVPVDQKA